MDAEIQAEYDRIKKGPQSGWFTFLHHNGPIIEISQDVMERINYILREKSKDEILTRLRHIYPMDDAYLAKRKPLYDDYLAKRKPLDDGYEAKLKPLYDGYLAKRKSLDDGYEAKRKSLDDEILVLIPKCQWDGKTILG